jgi:hypothetical protein
MPSTEWLVLYIFLAAAFLMGAYLCVLNFYLSFLRYPIHIRNGGTKESYKFVSGIPIFGSLFIYILLRNTNLPPAIFYLGVVLICIDTGGLHWGLGNMIYHAVLHLKKKLMP